MADEKTPLPPLAVFVEKRRLTKLRKSDDPDVRALIGHIDALEANQAALAHDYAVLAKQLDTNTRRAARVLAREQRGQPNE